MSTAAIVVIGNEILSGRTQDANLPWLSTQLNERGIQLVEGRIIPDIREVIADTVNDLRAKYDFIFTTGGIGPTHDDITTESIAHAFGVKVILHPEAHKLLQDYYGERLNDARLKMAHTPEGAELVENPVSVAPGYRMDNVYVLAGIPRIMQSMFDSIAPTLTGKNKVHSSTVTCHLAEGEIADALGALQKKYSEVDVGSYPHFRGGQLGLSIVLRGRDEDMLEHATDDVIALVREMGDSPGAVTLKNTAEVMDIDLD